MRIRGLDLDLSELDLPEGATTFSRNIIISKKAGARSNEDSNIFRQSYSNAICGIIELDDSRTIIFLGKDGRSELGVEDANGNYEALIIDPLLNFDWSRPIKGVSTRNGLNETVISWCDGVAEDSQNIRILNIDNFGFELNTSLGFLNSNQLELLALFPELPTPIFNLTEVKLSGGRLLTGTYFIFFRYILVDGSSSNTVGSSGPIYIADDTQPHFDGAPPGTDSTRAIAFNLTGLSDIYNTIEMLVVKRQGDVLAAEIAGAFEYSGGTIDITYTGLEIAETIDLEEVIVPTSVYSKADSITITEGRLAIAKLETSPDLDYQKYANNIKIKWRANQSGFVDRDYSSAKNETWIYSHRGFKSDEVYAFYANFIFKNGSKSAGFHIPGRAPLPDDRDNASGKAREIDSTGLKFQFEDTSLANGTMGFWENSNEVYGDKDDSDIWDQFGDTGNTLRGEKIRHHKFPSRKNLASVAYDKEMIYENAGSSDPNSPWIRPLAIEVYDIYVPPEIAVLVDSIEISYADRTIGSRTIIDEGLMQLPADLTVLPTTIPKVFDECRLYPFSLMRLEKAVISSHLVVEYNMYDFKDSSGTQKSQEVRPDLGLPANPDDDPLLPKLVAPLAPGNRTNGRFNGWIYNYSNQLVPVKKSFLLFADETAPGTSITNAEAPNYYVEFKQTETLDTEWSPLGTQANVNHIGMDVVSLRAHKIQVYSPLSEQELITINKITKVGNSGVYTTGDIYGGDTFICMVSQHVPIFSVTNLRLDNIYYYPLESSLNLSLRHNDPETLVEEKYYPENPPDGGGLQFDHYTYNSDYSALNNIKKVFPVDVIEQESNTSKLYHRIARSAVQGKESTELKWRSFLATDYYEMPKHTGEISNIQGSSRDMYIHTTNTLYFATVKDKLGSGEGTTFVGDGDLFDRLPEDIMPEGKGLFGCQDAFSTLLCKLGYVWINRLHKRVYIYSKRGGIKELNKEGMHNFFRDNLDVWESVVRDNPFMGSGFSTIFDEENNRLLINKINDGGDSFCLSYSTDIITGEGKQQKRGGFVSFHDREAYVLYNKRNKLYSLINNPFGLTYEEGIIGSKGIFYGVQYNSYVDIIFNQGRNVSKVWQSIHWYSDFIAPDGKTDYNRTVDQLLIYNQHSASGMLTLEKDKNLVRTEEGWNYNDFRDNTNQQEIQILDDKGNFIVGSVDTNLSWFKQGKFISKYIIIRLLTNNEDDYEMRLSDVSMKAIKSDR